MAGPSNTRLDGPRFEPVLAHHTKRKHRNRLRVFYCPQKPRKTATGRRTGRRKLRNTPHYSLIRTATPQKTDTPDIKNRPIQKDRSTGRRHGPQVSGADAPPPGDALTASQRLFRLAPVDSKDPNLGEMPRETGSTGTVDLELSTPR